MLSSDTIFTLFQGERKSKAAVIPQPSLQSVIHWLPDGATMEPGHSEECPWSSIKEWPPEAGPRTHLLRNALLFLHHCFPLSTVSWQKQGNTLQYIRVSFFVFLDPTFSSVNNLISLFPISKTKVLFIEASALALPSSSAQPPPILMWQPPSLELLLVPKNSLSPPC